MDNDADDRSRDGIDDSTYRKSIGWVWEKSTTHIAYDIINYPPWYASKASFHFCSSLLFISLAYCRKVLILGSNYLLFRMEIKLIWQMLFCSCIGMQQNNQLLLRLLCSQDSDCHGLWRQHQLPISFLFGNLQPSLLLLLSLSCHWYVVWEHISHIQL